MIRKLLYSKRFISGLAAVILAVSTITVMTKADVLQPKQPLTVSIGNLSLKQGGVGEIPVSINAPSTPVATYQMQLEFDHSKLEVTGIEPNHGSIASKCDNDKNGCFVSNINNNEGWLKTIWVDTSGGTTPITSDETLFTVRFKVKGNGPDQTNVTINSAQQGNLLLTDDQGKEIPSVQVTGGLVDIFVPASSSDNGNPSDGQTSTPSKEQGYIKIMKRINLWTRDQNEKLQFSRILNPGEVYKVYKMDQLYGGQYSVDAGGWVTNMDSYVSFRSINEFGSDAANFPRGSKNEIGYITITKPINLWKRESNGTLTVARILKKGETYRVYGTDKLHGGQYNVGGPYWVTQIWDHISFK